MANDVTHGPDQSVTKLLSGIIDDAHDLLHQQIDLIKVEIRKELKQAKETSYTFAGSAGLVGVGGLLLGFMLVYLLNAAVGASLPLWGCFCIVGALFTLGGVGLFFWGKEQLDEMTPLPEQSMKAMKENLQWTTKRN
jgi:hypothetical protein